MRVVREYLRIATAGSVDDGKSTLLGRLLHDSKSILADQLEAVERASRAKGAQAADLALLTDGLRAEREQGITIDVAYRYFATPRRSFRLADTPGHVQYTRNMITGASTADVALLLVDARKGVLEQTRRHAYLAALLRVPYLVLVVNKCDLVGWSPEVVDEIAEEFRRLAASLDVEDVAVVPVSALLGDNVVTTSPNTPWYSGPPLLALLEDLEVAPRVEQPRFPVQYVIRPPAPSDYRGYAGQVASGVFRVGEEVVVLPSGRRTTIAGIDLAGASLAEAVAGASVVMRLRDDLDVSRGDVVVPADAMPVPTQDLEATVAWLSEDVVLRPGDRFLVKHTTRTVKAVVRELRHAVDVTTLRTTPAQQLGLNDVGVVTLRTAQPLVADAYHDNRTTGAFLLIDELTGATAGAGMVA